MRMIKKVEDWCLRHALLRHGQKIVIACSGGPDSLALADVLLRLREKYQLKLAAAHFNHMFRGAEADEDARFVGAFCAARGLTCYQGKKDVPAFIKAQKLSPEEGARVLRYRFLHWAAEKFGSASIAVAHQQDDQAETVLLHLLRGAGGAGLSGMKAKCGRIIRPFLGVSRAEIEAYCRDRRLTPRFDCTNDETNYTRNRLRLTVLPQLARDFNPSVKTALCKSAQLIGDEHDFVQTIAAEKLATFLRERKSGLWIARQSVSAQHKAVQRELLRQMIEKKCGHLKGIGFWHVEKMIELTKHGTAGNFLELPGKLCFFCDDNAMCLSTERPIKKEPLPQPPYALPLGGAITFGTYRIETKLFDERPGADGKNTALFDGDALPLPLSVRFRQAGDVFQPLGMKGHKKLKKFFIDAKIPRQERDCVPLICGGGEILWLAGIRRSDKAKVSERTRHFLQINIQRKND